MANKITRIQGGTLRTARAQDATVGMNLQTYNGEYNVTPTTEQQTLATRNRLLTNNITVDPMSTDYEILSNKPQINDVTLVGNKSLEDLGIASEADLDGKQDAITASGILKGDGNGDITAATAGTDYGTYSKPSGGIPSSDMASAVQTSLGKANSAYQKPGGGIPSSDMASAVQTSLGKADTAYQKPSGGIPGTDLASGVIPDVSGKLDAPTTAGTQGQVLTSDGEGGQTWEDASGGGGTTDYEDLDNKPTINSVTLEGDLSLSDLSIASASDLDGKQAKITASGILKGDGSGGVTAATAGTDYGTYSKPSGGIPSTDMASAVQTSLGKADTAYQLPSGGMTSSDMASAVQTSLGKADTAYQKPSGGIPSTDMTSAVQTSLGKADTAYQKPSGGIPGTDLASGVIPTVPSASDATPQALGSAAAGSSSNYSRADHVHAKPSAADIGAIPTPSTAGTNGQVLTSDGNGGQSWQTPSSGNVIPEYTMTSASTATCNMTFAQVSAAVLAGKCDQAVMTYNGAEYTFHLDHRYTSDSSLSFYYIDVSTASVPPKYIGKHYILHGSNGNIGLEQFYVNEISDVTVNGSSVLSNGVAAITVPDVSGKLDAPTTAGTNGQVLTSNGSGGQTWQTISGLLPSVSSSDNGKFLRVSNGAWAAETVPTAVGVSF